MNEKQFVVVTTEHKGVFGGYGPDAPDADGRIVLTDARMCVYWHESVKGVTGLAAVGPIGASRISPKVPQLTLTGVTSVMVATPEAAEQWEKVAWK